MSFCIKYKYRILPLGLRLVNVTHARDKEGNVMSELLG
jgi:hypothetical protein